MRITIVGMGHGGTTIAADLTLRGHKITLLKTSNNIHNDHHLYMMNFKEVVITENGSTQKIKIHNVTDDFKVAFLDPELIIVYIQSNFHKQLIERMRTYLKGDETILFEPGYLSTAYMLEYCEKLNLTIIEAESSPIDCRLSSPGVTEVLYRNVRNPVGVYPIRNLPKAEKILNQLGYNFIFTSTVEAALHNPNLIVHTVGAIMSIPRIEYTKGDYWMYKEVFTPSVWRIVEKLDDEKMDILERLGYQRLPYIEACKIRNSLDSQRDALEVFRDYAMNGSPKGPDRVASRFITEDVPEGLVLLESLGKFLNIETTACTCLINLASIALDTQFRTFGRSIDNLKYENISKIIGDVKTL